jgi:hypothetical protein
MAETGKPIVKIAVDTEEFDDFQKKFASYQEQLAAQPRAWDSIDTSIGGVRSSFDQAANSFITLNRAALDPKLLASLGNVEKSSKNTATFWKATTLDLEKSSKFMTNIARGNLSLAAFGGVLGAAAGLGGAVAGAATASTSDIATKNRDARSLDLPFGATQAFTADFQQFGLGEADLSKMADVQSDIKKWRPLLAAGFSTDEIKNDDVEKLTSDFAKRASQQYSAWQKAGLPASTLAESRGFNQILSNGQLRTGASYGPEAFDTQQAQYEKDQPQMAIDQAQADAATKNKSILDANWQMSINAIEGAFDTLTPEITKLETGFTQATVAFLKSKDVKADLEDLASGLESVNKFLHFVGKVNADPKNSPDAGAQDSVHQFGIDAVKGVKRAWDDLTSGHADKVFGSVGQTPTPTDIHDSSWGWHHPFGTLTHDDGGPAPDLGNGADWGSGDKAHDFAAKVAAALPVISKIESNGNPSAVNPASGAAGEYQLMPATARKLNIDPMDPVASKAAAGKVLTDFLEKYHGDFAKALAGYDGDGHIDADEKKYGGDWLRGAKPETLSYLDKAEKYGLDLGLSDANRAYISEQLGTVPGSTRSTDTGSSSDRNQGYGFQVPRPLASTAQAPFNLNVNVSNPAGASVAISAGSLPQ